MGRVQKSLEENLKQVEELLWVGRDQKARTKVAWNICYKKRKEKGLGFMDLELAKRSLLC